jgi:large subunit ribosomal protein L15
VKLHDLHPTAALARTRVGRGIAAGQGKTAGRGTKGQRSRTGASIPAWFEGGQTPIHIRVPKLHGFKNKFKVHYEVVNVGQIAAYAGPVALAGQAADGKRGDARPGGPDSWRRQAAQGARGGRGRPQAVRRRRRLSASARAKIEAAGGFVQVLARGATGAGREPPPRSQGQEGRQGLKAPTPAAAVESRPQGRIGDSADRIVRIG